MDRRQRKTRQAVYAAFTRLLEKKSYFNITVQEIIDGADISRSTFYTHFETKDDLLKSLCTEIFAHVFSEDPGRENTHDFSRRKKNLKDELTHILYHLQDSRTYIRSLLSGESGEIFMKSFKGYLWGIFEKELGGYPSDVPEDYVINHVVCDFTETVRWWMGHPEHTPEETCHYFFSLLPAAIQEALYQL